MKRGISAVFQYMFAAIVGAIILFFFIKFAFNTEETYSNLNSAIVSNNIRDAFTVISTGKQVTTTFPNQDGWSEDIKIQFGYNANCGKISVNQKGFYPIDRIIFSSSEINEKRFDVWAKEWEYPFRITHFYYVKGIKTKYFLIYDSSTESLTKRIASSSEDNLDGIPTRFNVVALPKAQITTSFLNQELVGVEKIHLVYFTSPNQNPTDKIVVKQINPTNCGLAQSQKEHNCYGTIKFQSQEYPFIGLPMFFGAIFADENNYQCNLERANERFNVLADVYYEEAKLLSMKTTDCENKYNEVMNTILNLKQSLSNSNKDALIAANKNLFMSGSACPSVFHYTI